MSTYQLLTDTFAESIGFTRILLKLARAELIGQFSKAGRGSAFGLAAVMAVSIGVVFLLLGAVALMIAYGLAAYLAFFVMGGGLLMIGLLLGLASRSCFKGITLQPDRTLDQMRRFSVAVHESESDVTP